MATATIPQLFSPTTQRFRATRWRVSICFLVVVLFVGFLKGIILACGAVFDWSSFADFFAGGVIGIILGNLLLPIRVHDIELMDHELVGPVVVGPVRVSWLSFRRIVVPLSRIHIQGSRCSVWTRSFLRTTDGRNIILNVAFLGARNVRRLFDEIRKRQEQSGDHEVKQESWEIEASRGFAWRLG